MEHGEPLGGDGGSSGGNCRDDRDSNGGDSDGGDDGDRGISESCSAVTVAKSCSSDGAVADTRKVVLRVGEPHWTKHTEQIAQVVVVQ